MPRSEEPTYRYVGRVPIRFSQFYLGERDHECPIRPMFKCGLMGIKNGQIKFTVETRESYANLVIEAYGEPPAGRDADYQDVVEGSYHCVSGELGLLDWSKSLIESLAPLPVGSGEYRIRYHVRNTADLAVPEADASPAECLVQIWPQTWEEAAEVKITSSSGRFWHPTERLAWPFARTIDT
ncbi:hypothetical protein ACFXPA_38435 [Amycolatopsis sp. NPDC059090]|uniref:hypothetical protein n=1 Tax=unclassified Amycolatopsis TaxID=2618356 RepID=UPI00366D25C2